MSAVYELFPEHDFTPPAGWCQCSECGTVDSDGCCGPEQLRGGEGSYERYALWLCAPCSRRVWRAYYRAVRLRMAIIWESRRAGFPLTKAQYRARVARRSVQLRLV